MVFLPLVAHYCLRQLPCAECTGQSSLRKERGSTCQRYLLRVLSRKPKLGQHFLVNDSAALRIVDALAISRGSTVLEIGPGRGAITSLLAKRARRLIAIETRSRAGRATAHEFRPRSQRRDHRRATSSPSTFDTIFGPKPGNSRPGIEYKPAPARVVGNLPYFITSDILLRLFEYRQYFDTLILMVQKEVADRMAAEPGGSDYGLLSATTQLYSQRRESCSRFRPEHSLRRPKFIPRWSASTSLQDSRSYTCPRPASSTFSSNPSDRNVRRCGTI